MLSQRIEAMTSHFSHEDICRRIAQHRKALRFERNSFGRAQIYLELARLYRILVRMKNAHLELKRALAELKSSWPKNTLLATVRAYLIEDETQNFHVDFKTQPPEKRAAFYAELYEEIGLSAYYLRQNFVMLQSIIKTQKPCRTLGNSRALLNWFGGSACVLALIGFRKLSQNLILKCSEVAKKLNSPEHFAKSLIWSALAYDYLGEPVSSAATFEKCLLEFGFTLGPSDLRLATTTLSLNYLSRGHNERALLALRELKQSPLADSAWSLDSAAWYKIGPQALLGETHSFEKVNSIFSSIMSVDKDEKWLLAQFLGQLLILERSQGADFERVEDIGRRFRVLGMSPQHTHFETCLYWVAMAYCRFDLARKNASQIAPFKRSLRDLRRTPFHPSIRAHEMVLRAQLYRLQNKMSSMERALQRAKIVADRHDNQWVKSEINKMARIA